MGKMHKIFIHANRLLMGRDDPQTYKLSQVGGIRLLMIFNPFLDTELKGQNTKDGCNKRNQPAAKHSEIQNNKNS
ncbi:hypothetical protein D1872_343830 [compost metagenome]